MEVVSFFCLNAKNERPVMLPVELQISYYIMPDAAMLTFLVTHSKSGFIFVQHLRGF